LEFEEAARLRDEVKRLKAVELAVSDDPLTRQSNIEEATASWPSPAPRPRAASKGGKPGSRTFGGRKR
jgi:excinuclease ABC subunit B